LFDQRPILGHIIESLKDCLQRNLIVPGEFSGNARIRTVNGLVDHRCSDPPILEE